jgi:hypothetical protein
MHCPFLKSEWKVQLTNVACPKCPETRNVNVVLAVFGQRERVESQKRGENYSAFFRMRLGIGQVNAEILAHRVVLARTDVQLGPLCWAEFSDRVTHFFIHEGKHLFLQRSLNFFLAI